MAGKQKTGNKTRYYVLYTLLFLLCCVVILNYFYLNGKTFINYVDDGLFQHYQSQVYLARHIRTIFKELFQNHRFVIPQWDHSIGEGSDIIASLHSDVVGDPLTALVFLFKDVDVYRFYDLLILLKIYLSGVMFSELCFYTGKKNVYGILAGAMVYDFCYYSLANLTGHSYFYTPMMYLPMIILGVEKIIKGDKPYMMILGVFLAAISQLYFFFMVVMLTVIYVVARLLTLYGKDFKSIIDKLVRIFLASLLGLLLSAIIVLPMVYVYMSDVRMGIEIKNNILYERFYYERLLTIFLSNDNVYDLCLGYASPVLLSLFLLLKDWKKDRLLLILNLVGLLCICIPFLGKAINGFRFVSSRWCFGISLLVAYTFTHKWEEIKGNKLYLMAMSFLTFLLACVSAWSRVDRVLIPLCIMLFFLILSDADFKKQFWGIDLKQSLLLGLVLFNIFYIADYDISYRGSNRIRFVMDAEEVRDLFESSETNVVKKYTDQNESDPFFRYSGDSLIPNNAMLYDMYSTDYYFSITNPSDQLFRNELDLTNRCSWMIKGYEGRAELNTLANVKYYISNSQYTKNLPYGFSETYANEEYKIYKNDHYVPFGYTYSDSIAYDRWLELGPVEKEEAMMQAVVLKDGKNTKIDLSEKDIPYEVVCGDGVEYNDGKLNISEEDGSFTLNFKGLPECETYLVIEGLNFIDEYGVVEDDHTESLITVKGSNNVDKVVYYLTQNHHYYYGKQDYAICLNYDQVALDSITVSISLPGVYEIRNMSVICLPLENYKTYTESLSKDTLDNVSIDINKATGTIDLDEDKYMLLSIPYSKGWKAKVDGNEAEVLQANEHYMALALSAGHHTIELDYKTPMLVQGALISLGATLILVYLFVSDKRRKKQG